MYLRSQDNIFALLSTLLKTILKTIAMECMLKE